MNPPRSTSADEAFLEIALEEQLGGAVPPDLVARIRRSANGTPMPRRPRPAPATAADRPATTRCARNHRLLAAALLLVGSAVVAGVALDSRSNRSGFAAQEPQGRDDKPHSMAAAAWFPLSLGARWEYRQARDGDERKITVTATAAALVGGMPVVQLTELDGSEPRFSFWSTDEHGVHQHASQGTSGDPLFIAAGVHGCVLPSPLGAEAKWSWRRLPAIELPKFGAAAVGRRTPADAIDCQATLLGVAEALRIGDRDWSCVHVRIDCTTKNGPCEEHVWYARGVGVVRHAVHVEGQPEVLRELVQFTPAPPAPDRSNVLTALINAPGKHCEWVTFPPEDDAAWTLRSTFALVREGDAIRVFRVFGDHAVAFDRTRIEDFQALAADEDFGPRMEGLFPQRATVGLARLAARLHALQYEGNTVRDGKGFRAEIGQAAAKVEISVVVTDQDGKDQQLVVKARMTMKGVPEQVDIQQ